MSTVRFKILLLVVVLFSILADASIPAPLTQIPGTDTYVPVFISNYNKDGEYINEPKTTVNFPVFDRKYKFTIEAYEELQQLTETDNEKI